MLVSQQHLDRPSSFSPSTKSPTLSYTAAGAKLSRPPAEVADRFGPVSWELIDMARRYRPTIRITAPVFLIRTLTHPKSVFQDWGHLTGGFEEHIVLGDAFSMLAAPVVKIVGAGLDEALRDHRDRS